MTFESQKLRDASEVQVCVRCGNTEGVCGCHYTGMRRLAYGGGYGIKVHDFLTADLCQECHRHMDTLSRSKLMKVEHSEEFQHYVILTLERRFLQGIIIVKGQRYETLQSTPRVVAHVPHQAPETAPAADSMGAGVRDRQGSPM